MADESILTMKRPGFPKEQISSEGKRTVIEYVGEYDDLRGAGVTTGQEWGSYDGIVEDADLDPIEGTTKAILSVRMLFQFGSTSYPESGEGSAQKTTHEVEWVDVSRPLTDHPKFASGGTYELNNDDIIQLRKWQDMPDTSLRSQWKFYTGDESQGETTTGTLSTNAQMAAKGILLLGGDTYIDKAPVLRRKTIYANGPPPQDGAGEKEDPTGFPMISGLSGYEWRKESDRSVETGTAKEWMREEEYAGATKVLIDRSEIYWS